MPHKGKILIVDDDKNILKSLTILLENEFRQVDVISNPNLILSKYTQEKYDVVLLDMNFSAGLNTGNEGIFWLNEILKSDQDACVVLITAYGDISLAVKAMKEGAADFIIKPWNNDKLIHTLRSAIKIRESQLEANKRVENNNGHEKNAPQSEYKIIGSSPEIERIFYLIDKVAGTEANVLITGENGTGKELIAKEIHRKSMRSQKPLISVDMGSISETLFESELFGHTQGAFTDAKKDRMGKFEIAHGGSLFLDEISNIPFPLQSKLLRVLQNREISPVGSNETKPIDIRLIAATNKNPEKLIEEGLFREDLYYRINTVQIELPPLRKRKGDILAIASHYLEVYNAKYNRNIFKVSEDAKNMLLQYTWPGNIRELRHTIEKAVILSSSDTLKTEDLMLKQESKTNEWPLKFEEIEKMAIERALQNNAGKMIDAAKELGLTRQTLYNKLKKYNL